MNPLLVTLLLSLGGSVGTAFVTNPNLKSIIGTAVTSTTQLLSTLLNRQAGQSVAAPTFAIAFQAAINILVAEGKLTADEATALTKTASDVLAADAKAQLVIDPSLLATPLPTLA